MLLCICNMTCHELRQTSLSGSSPRPGHLWSAVKGHSCMCRSFSQSHTFISGSLITQQHGGVGCWMGQLASRRNLQHTSVTHGAFLERAAVLVGPSTADLYWRRFVLGSCLAQGTMQTMGCHLWGLYSLMALQISRIIEDTTLPALRVANQCILGQARQLSSCNHRGGQSPATAP